MGTLRKSRTRKTWRKQRSGASTRFPSGRPPAWWSTSPAVPSRGECTSRLPTGTTPCGWGTRPPSLRRSPCGTGRCTRWRLPRQGRARKTRCWGCRWGVRQGISPCRLCIVAMEATLMPGDSGPIRTRWRSFSRIQGRRRIPPVALFLMLLQSNAFYSQASPKVIFIVFTLKDLQRGVFLNWWRWDSNWRHLIWHRCDTILLNDLFHLYKLKLLVVRCI